MAWLPLLMGGVSSLAKGAAKTLGTGSSKDKDKKRRRKARLTSRDMQELTTLKSVIGKTAAANALPYYLGRR